MKFRTQLRNIATYASAVLAVAVTESVFALTKTDLTQDSSGGKSLIDSMNKTGEAGQIFSTLALLVFTIVGVIIVGLSILTLWTNSKDPQRAQSWAGPVVGIFAGGALTAVSALTWMSRNSII